MNRFAKFAWGVLFYNILVIVWGAYVRASKAGAGCGDHWPDCNGQIIPLAGGLKTLIEFTHRATSGLAGIIVLIMFIWAFRAFPKRHSVRYGAALSLVFIIIEALLGAMLVKKGLVVDNDSVARAVVISVHLVNTLLLLAFLTITAWLALRRETGNPFSLQGQTKAALLLCASLLSVMFLSASGAITALGATLFPVQSIAEGIARNFSPNHFLESLIWIHPVAAVLLGLSMTFIIVLLGLSKQHPTISLLSKIQIGLFVMQIILGGLNILLHAPVWMQLVHLFIADLVWVNLLLFTATYFMRADEIPALTRRQEDSQIPVGVVPAQK